MVEIRFQELDVYQKFVFVWTGGECLWVIKINFVGIGLGWR